MNPEAFLRQARDYEEARHVGPPPGGGGGGGVEHGVLATTRSGDQNARRCPLSRLRE